MINIKLLVSIGLTFLILSCQSETTIVINNDKDQEEDNSEKGKIALVIHGGAGAIKKENMSDEQEAKYMSILDSVITLGYEKLEAGENAIDVVPFLITILEDSPLFNAGRGAVFTHDEENELDASIMIGSNKNAGAVAGVKTIKNPILLARKVMEESDHVIMSGRGAESFAKQVGIETVSPDYFRVENRLKSLKKVKEREAKSADLSAQHYDESIKDEKFGTVGCVALDKNGEIVAGTSTGGMTNKRWGRIGDSPIIGAGTYADNKTCGVSSTGWGEFFIRGVIAYDISALMAYKSLSLKEATSEVIQNKLPELGGDGGVIALDFKGNISMEFNTPGMFRAAIDGTGEKVVAIYDK